eukprot:CAMPEP_0183421536 /NCGR_PEP_ID=MMETSP0370-20130417/27170_1 /TAXON_ID=268820 /ORGANISM="Peridinium aciculiferum, Strain PAER-2" /LENGTH=88 /DNA_ID=CAMNT_0025605531 /DNA_START=655 /DNA_END=921 /DNA_ORIENTATION=-
MTAKLSVIFACPEETCNVFTSCKTRRKACMMKSPETMSTGTALFHACTASAVNRDEPATSAASTASTVASCTGGGRISLIYGDLLWTT